MVRLQTEKPLGECCARARTELNQNLFVIKELKINFEMQTTKRSIENNLTETGNLIPAAISDSTVSMKNLKRSVGVQWSINDSLGMGKVSSKNLEKSIKTIGHIENVSMSIEYGNLQKLRNKYIFFYFRNISPWEKAYNINVLLGKNLQEK